MISMMKPTIRFLVKEEGLEITEYAILSVLICLIIIPAAGALGTTASSVLSRIAAIIASAIP